MTESANPKSPRPVYFLLVDDLEENLLSLEALLRQPGLILLKARSGPEALEYLLKYDVALALLDIQMPVMDGFELAELMRGSEKTRHVPIIFLTAGSADWQRRFRGYEAGAVDFLHKPIEPHMLRSKAKVFFDLFRQQQTLADQRDALALKSFENANLLEESRQAAEALKDADRRKDEFLATLAHELRNPLAPIRNGLNVLRMSQNPAIHEEVRGMMDRQVNHLVRLIDDLMDVSRVSQGKIDLRMERISIQSVIQAAVESSRSLIDANSHTLEVSVPEDDIWLRADLTRMAQTVANLLNNAAKYTPNGGHISLRAMQDSGEVVIAVTDNGLGIRRDMLNSIFDLFTQVDRSLDRSQGGLGIGLALVQRLVTLHGGHISADSAGLGQGSTFTIRLPAGDIAAVDEDKGPAADEENENTSGLNVLVVDDNLESAKTTGWMMELIGHNAFLSHDGLDALEQAKKLKPDVILLDIGLPGMNGYEVCQTLRADPAFKDTLLIAQTGWGQEKDRQLAKEAGFDHHLTKPLNMEDLSRLFTQFTNAQAGVKSLPDV
ncbi:MAG: histidine kinase [Micavibrio sp.]|nr:histidine kinase [Micavibrio sp.]